MNEQPVGRTRQNEGSTSGHADRDDMVSVRGPSLLGLEEDGRNLYGIIAHKLNTPVWTIRGFVTTLLKRGEELDSESVQQFLRLILIQTDRILALDRELLLLAGFDGGIQTLIRPCRPRDLLLSLSDEFGEERSRIRLAGDLDAELVCDAELIKQALDPLVRNGLLYGPRLGMVTLTVTISPEVSRWAVHDTGSRLTSERISQLFRPFPPFSEPIERRGSGAGLGLALATKYAEVLNGTVAGRVDDHGTVFWLDVPTPTPQSDPSPGK